MIVYGSRVWYVLNVVQCGPKLIPIHDQPSLIPVISHLAGDHFDGHADLNGGVVHVGELGGDHGTFVQFDQGHGIGSVGVVSAGAS